MKPQATPIVHIAIRGGALESVDCDQDIHVIITDWDNYDQRAGNMFDLFHAEKVQRRNLAGSYHQARRRRINKLQEQQG